MAESTEPAAGANGGGTPEPQYESEKGCLTLLALLAVCAVATLGLVLLVARTQ